MAPARRCALGRRAAFRFEYPLRRCGILRQHGERPDRAAREIAAAVRAAALQRALDAVVAERAFERTDHRVGRVRPKVAVAAFAVRSQCQHECTPLTKPSLIWRRPLEDTTIHDVEAEQ